MNRRVALKRLVEGIPPPLGRAVAHVPHSWRLGPSYPRARATIARFATMEADERRDWIFRRVAGCTLAAYTTTGFYRRHYDRHGFHPADLERFDDLAGIPLVTREQLQEEPLDERSVPHHGRLPRNTGGTSGQPLQFYVDRNAFGREWAHMHHAWSTVGYRPHLLKLTFRGGTRGASPLSYSAVHHEYQVNLYCSHDDLHGALAHLLARQRVCFLHGYPSAIAEFVAEASLRAPQVLRLLRRDLRAVLLGSEFPAPPYRETIERALAVPTLSWYGHSEMVLYAYERQQPYAYEPMHTYGYAEAVPDGEGGHRLVGTSYGNLASPFIRYDTGDRVEPSHEDGLLAAFQVTHGRVGEFVEDAAGRRISLTALVFGRHHRAFGRARFVQLRPEAPGRVTLVITTPEHRTSTSAAWAKDFDLGDVDIDFTVELVAEPVRAPSGKVPLLLR